MAVTVWTWLVALAGLDQHQERHDDGDYRDDDDQKDKHGCGGSMSVGEVQTGSPINAHAALRFLRLGK